MVPEPPVASDSLFDGAYRLVIALAVILAILVGVRVVGGPATSAPGASPSAVPPQAYLYPDTRVAPALSALVDQDGAPFQQSVLTGGPTLVFFGYTHCPDVCPATTGIINEVLAEYGTAMRAVFVSVDPERDTVAWLKDYVKYLPKGFSALTGSAVQVKTTADLWAVRYARVETGTPGEYSMSHTADVYLVDGVGSLRAHFPFGTQADAMLATVRLVTGAGAPARSAAPTAAIAPTTAPTLAPGATTGPVGALSVEVVSSSVWAGPATPVIMRLTGPGGRLADTRLAVSIQITTDDGRGEVVSRATAVAVKPPSVPDVSYVASVKLPSPGWWRMTVSTQVGDTRLVGAIALAALDPGTTSSIGTHAPAVHTPTLDDVGGVALKITTDPLPDLRLSRTSTTDALAARKPFVLIVDSGRFKVTPACGKALGLAKYLVDRWPTVPFIHLEPYAYDVITDTAVIRGSLSAPTIVPAADAWGVAGQRWGAGSMPWVFIVDGNGTIRAKYQGVVGSDDIDIIVALIQQGS